jgi:hypothetical protein
MLHRNFICIACNLIAPLLQHALNFCPVSLVVTVIISWYLVVSHWMLLGFESGEKEVDWFSWCPAQKLSKGRMP